MIPRLFPFAAFFFALILPATARETPRTVTPLQPSEHLVGQRLPERTFKAIDGRTLELKPLEAPAVGTVIALTSTSCPLCQKYGKALGRIERTYTAKGFRFVYLNPTPFEKAADIKRDQAAFGWKAPYVQDAEAKLASVLGALTTTDIFVVDATNTLVYRGPVDDQHGISSSLPKARTTHLADTLDAILEGTAVPQPALWAPGCVLDLKAPARLTDGITYHNRISRILQANCLRCHHEGGGAPFALETYKQVVKKKGMIASVVEDGIMPPWFAEPSHVKWSNDATLPEADREDLLAWLASDRPEGDPADAPLPREWPTDWVIGEPDQVFRLPRPVKVKAEGIMDYVNVRVPTGFKEDKWVQAIELRPTDPTVVHHGLVFVRPPRKPVGGAKNNKAPGLGT